MCGLLFPVLKMALKARIFDDYQRDPHKNAEHTCCQKTDITLINRMYMYTFTDECTSDCLKKKNNIKIYIKTAPTCFGIVTPQAAC